MPNPTATRADLRGGTVWMALGLALIVGAWRMDRFESMGASLYTAPGLVPAIYGLLLLGMGGALAWRSRRAPADLLEPLLNRRILLTLALTLAYAAVAVGRLPFGPSTAVFVAVFCWLFDERGPAWPRLRTALIAGVACAVLVVLVFERVFLVRLP